MDKLNPEELENVSGGKMRTVNTQTGIDAVVRGGPGMEYGQIGSLEDQTQVNTTGYKRYNPMDRRTWYEIDYPMYGWMAGRLLGYYD